MRIRKLTLSRKVKTVNDLLARSDVNDVLDCLVHCKSDITDIIAVYKDSEGHIWYSSAMNEQDDKTSDIKAVGLLEYAKNMILNPPEDEEE